MQNAVRYVHKGNEIWGQPLWQYGLLSFQAGGTKLERFLHKNQHTMRTNLLNWCDLVSISKKLMFYVFGMVRIY